MNRKCKLFYDVLLAFCVLFLSSTLLYAQEKPIKLSGLVLDMDKKPISGAIITNINSGTKGSASTDVNGKFTINTTENGIVKVSYIGFASQTIALRGRKELTVTLQAENRSLEEVVVTAMGIKRDVRSLTSAQQSIDVNSMTEVRGSNLLDMLSGKAAGMQVVPGGGPLGSTRIVIRGNNSLTGNNQPLFVIDGVPMLNNSGESGDLDYGSAVNSINPDEIENIEILKGANASALYGSDAANGVVLITTKKAGRKQGLGISYGFNAMFGSLYSYPTYQNIYGAGQNGRFQRREGVNYFGNSNNGVNFNPDLPYGIWNPNQGNQDNRSWGLPMLGFDVVGRNGQVKSYIPQESTIKNMYQTSHALTNSIALDKLTDQMSFRLSYTNQHANDILEKFNLYDRHNFNLRSTAKITNYFDVDASVRYTLEDVKNRGYRNASDRNPLYAIANLPRDASIAELIPWKQPDGTPFNFNGFRNPYWLLNETANADDKNMFNANLTLNLKLGNLFRLRLRGATDLQKSKGWDFTNLYSPFDTDGDYSKWNRSWTNNNFDALLSFNKTLKKDFNISANGGASIQRIDGDRISSRNFMLLFPDQRTLSNTRGITSSLEEIERKEKQAVFGMTSFSYKNRLFFDATVRNEWSSSLPKSNNSYFYYSFGTGLIMTDLLQIKNSPLSYWKLRASYAQVGNDTGFDRLLTGYYRPDGGSFLGLPYYVGEEVLKNPNLKPEQTQSWEAGTEFKLWNDRITADITYYSKRTKDQIVEADAPLASGYRREILNAGEIKNWGTEVSLNIIPVKTKLVTWTTGFNWSKNNSKVVSLVAGVNRYEMGSGDNIKLYAEVGKSYGVFYGNDYKRNAEGAIYVGADGKPKFLPDQYLGEIQPRWFGGWKNTVNIGRFSIGTMLDFQSGGKVWSYTAFRGGIDGSTVQTLDGRWEYMLSDLILGENTEERRGFLQPGNTVRPGADYNENYVMYPDYGRSKGIQLGNTVYDPSVSEFWADKPALAWVSPMDHWTHNSASSAARYIYDASYIKLREVSVGYNFSPQWFRATPIKDARLSLVGRNVAILFQNTPKGMDPQATSTTGNAQGFERGFNLPMATWGFDLKLSF